MAVVRGTEALSTVFPARSRSTPDLVEWCPKSPPGPMSRRSGPSPTGHWSNRGSTRPISMASPPPAGPGLVGALLVGHSFAKATAWARQLPFIGVDHMEGH